MQNHNFKHYKIITIGDTSVGKTQLLSSYYTNKSNKIVFPLPGIPCFIKDVFINNENIKIQLYDTFGEERYKNYMNEQYYRNANGIFLCYDITNYKSFENLDKWYNDCKKYLFDYEIVLVGTKSDRQDIRQIPYNIALEYAKNKNIDYFEVSTYNVEGINNLFTFLINKIINKTHSNILDEEPFTKQEKKYCCIL
jgi:small GTP-binding protein